MTNAPRRLALLAALLVFLPPLPSAAADRIVVGSLKLHGVEQLEPGDVKEALVTKASSWWPWGRKHYFDRARFEDDLRRIVAYYVDQGFPDARVTSFDVRLNEAQDRVELEIEIAEGQPIRVEGVTLRGFEVMPEAPRHQLDQQLPIQPGQPFRRLTLALAQDTAQNALMDLGYAYARVTATDRPAGGPYRVTVELVAEPGEKAYFGPIEITGTRSVTETVVRRELLYTPGDLFRRSVMQRSQRRLYDLRLFRFANIRVQQPGRERPAAEDRADRAAGPVSQEPQAALSPVPPLAGVPTRVVVAEGKRRRVNLSVGYGTEEKARGEIQLNDHNFFGGARTAGVHAKWSSIDRGIRAVFNQPYLFGPGRSLGVEGHRWYESAPGYRLTSSGAKGSVHRRRGAFAWSLGYVNDYQNSQLSDYALEDPTLRDELIALGFDPRTGAQEGTVSAVSLELQRNTADNPLNATTGSFVSAHAERADHFLTGTFAYTNLALEARRFVPVGRRVVLAGRVRGGAIQPAGNREHEVPFFKRYFLGGSDSLRGWGRYEVSPLSGSGLPIGGFTMLEGTGEIRVAVRGSLGLVAFVDLGSVSSQAWRVDPGSFRYDAGAGLRYQTPVGPLRVDLGYQINPIPGLRVGGELQSRRWRVHFSIGQAF